MPVTYQDYLEQQKKSAASALEHGNTQAAPQSEEAWNSQDDAGRWGSVGGLIDLSPGDARYEDMRKQITSTPGLEGSDTRSIVWGQNQGGADKSKTIGADGGYLWSNDNSVHPKDSLKENLMMAALPILAGMTGGFGLAGAGALVGEAGTAGAASLGAAEAGTAGAAGLFPEAGASLPGFASGTGLAEAGASGFSFMDPSTWGSKLAEMGGNMDWSDLPWKDIIKGGSDLFAGHRAEQNTEGDFNRQANYNREMFQRALQAGRPNQSNAWGDQRQWTQDEKGNWVQKDTFSSDKQERADIFNQIAKQRMKDAAAGSHPDYEKMGLGHLLGGPGGTTGKRPWADSPTSSMGGDYLRNLPAPSVAANGSWGPLPSTPPGAGTPSGGNPLVPPGAMGIDPAMQKPIPPMGPSAGGGALAGNPAARPPMPAPPPPAPMGSPGGAAMPGMMQPVGAPPAPMGSPGSAAMPGMAMPSAGGAQLSPELVQQLRDLMNRGA